MPIPPEQPGCPLGGPFPISIVAVVRYTPSHGAGWSQPVTYCAHPFTLLPAPTSLFLNGERDSMAGLRGQLRPCFVILSAGAERPIDLRPG
jgi:hypothetical protein